jgi:short-subunit dehydrogenase
MESMGMDNAARDEDYDDTDREAEDVSTSSRRKFAVVTGASTGIGYELAKQFAENDYDLIVASEEGAIVESAQALRQIGGDVTACKVDLTKPAGVKRLYAEIQRAGRNVDALALNAGVAVHGDFTRDNAWEKELNLINLNVTSVVHLAKLVLPDMVKVGRGRVLITSSIAALMPGPMYATYAASKSFLLSFAEAIHAELEGTGVTVTALMPGATETEFFRRAGMEDTKVGSAKKDSAELVARQGYQAMMAGRDHVIGGSITNQLQGFATRFLSDHQRAELQRQQTAPKN